MNIDDARSLAMSFIWKHYDVAEDEPVIGDAYTIVKPYGWVFFYGSRRFLETGEVCAQIGGNGPILVLTTGELVALPSAYPPEEALRRFETERRLTP